MIYVDIILTTFRQQINPKQNSQLCDQLQHEMVKSQLTKFIVSITGTTAVNWQPRNTRFERCSQLFCFKPHEILSLSAG